LNSDVEAGSGQGDLDQEAAIARVLARRRRKADQLRRFKEKQGRQRRWVPLSAAIDWLASFNAQGERITPDNGKAALFTAEIWNAFCGTDILTNFKLGGGELPWCIIEDGHQDHAISRFRRGDLILGASDDKGMQSALIKRLWVPRASLLNLFREKRWPIAPWLELPPAPIVDTLPDKITAGPTPVETYLSWVAQNVAQNNMPSRDDCLAHMRAIFPEIKDNDVRDLRRDHAPAAWKSPGRRPIKTA
jgi:hypothetical protein